MRLTTLLSALALLLLTVLATPVTPVGEAVVEVDVAPRQISLNPASSCPQGQLWCCVTVDLVRYVHLSNGHLWYNETSICLDIEFAHSWAPRHARYLGSHRD